LGVFFIVDDVCSKGANDGPGYRWDEQHSGRSCVLPRIGRSLEIREVIWALGMRLVRRQVPPADYYVVRAVHVYAVVPIPAPALY
jgi:hypothetical protein